MRTLGIDIETFSSVDLTSVGVYRYASAPDFQVLLFGYCFDDEEVKVVDLAQGEALPKEVLDALTDDDVLKTAYNANFERICLSEHLKTQLAPNSWRCTAVQAAMLGLPLYLDGVAKALKLQVQKDRTGKDLIRYFSMPCKESKVNGGRTKNLPSHAPDKWESFKEYCKTDVEVEMELRRRIQKYPIPEKELELWLLDQRINDAGALIDTSLVKNAINCDAANFEKLEAQAKELTGVDNPNSVAQLKAWFKGQGYEVQSLSKQVVEEMVEDADGELEKLLRLRLEMAKTSIKKYEAIKRSVCLDGRVRGMFRFYGANRTGRFSSQLIQIHNLPRNELADLELARNLVKNSRFQDLEMLYESIPAVLSQLIRTAFIPGEGNRFIVADFSSIEARVLAWLSGESWVLETFKGHGRIYEQTAAKMFGVPVEKIVKGNAEYELRAKGKVATLACIAEGQMVLTDKGLVPIQNVTLEHKVWDGQSWVKHDGVVYQGVKEVITYGGLTATKDHLVWVEGESEPVRFEKAATNGSHLLRTGDGGRGLENHRCKARLYDILNAGPNNRFTVSDCLVHNCGYQGGVNALKAMGADRMGLADDELDIIVKAWRGANSKIVKFWYEVERAAVKAVKDRNPQRVGNIGFLVESGILFIILPSGRKLAYVRPRIEMDPVFNKEGLTYQGIGLNKQWGRQKTYGGKLVENITQAIARDCLAEAMLRVDKAGYKIVMHIHDEIVAQMPCGEGSLKDMCDIMAQNPNWAKRLPLGADGFECNYYKKE